MKNDSNKDSRKPTINMRSSKIRVKGQGVLSCYDEQVNLVKNRLDNFTVYENKRAHADIVHYHTVDFPHYIDRILRKRRSIGVGYVHFLPETVDDSVKLPRIARWVFYKYLMWFYNSMDYLVTVNPIFIEKIKNCGISSPELLCIPNFVSKANFHPLEKEQKLAVREKYSLSPDRFVVLGVGQLQTRKGVMDFIETAKSLPDVQFIWAGGFSFGKITDGYEQIKKIVDNPPMNVRFLGIIEREEMNEVYNMADVMFLPSFDELFPMSILEALAAKIPVLLRDIPVYETILDGAYVKASDVEGFSQAIISLTDDSENYQKWVERAWDCSRIYSEEGIAKMWQEFYTEAYEAFLAKSEGKEVYFG